MNSLVYLGILFAAAYATKEVSKRLGIPEVTGYVLLGVLLGGSLAHLLTPRVLADLQPVSTLALGLIAFIIGIELRFQTIRKIGRSIIWIILFEGLGTFAVVLVTISLIFPGNPAQTLLLAAVAAATAPAATVAVIRQYRAKGTLTSTILAVVGMDDALALIIYVVVSSVAKETLTGDTVSIGGIALTALTSLGMSLGLGLAGGLLFVLILKRVRNNDWITLLLAAALLLLLGVSEMLEVSELLAIMVFGALVANSNASLAERSETIISAFSPIFLAAFFVLGGAHLDVRLIVSIGVLGLVYFAARSVGKIAFASLGAVIGGAEKKVRRSIGFALLPQVGVALALALAISTEFTSPEYGSAGKAIATTIINVLLFTTILTEIVGPLLTRRVLRVAGEAQASTD